MRILVTGPGGIGAAVLDALADAGLTGRVVSRSGATPVPAGWEGVRADITAPASLRDVCRGCDCVLHLAATTHSNDRREYESVNLGGTRNLLAEARVTAVRHFIHVSTRAIDPRGGAYSRSKAEAEEVVRTGGVPWTILRPAEVYGAGREGLARVIERARQGRWIPVVGDGRWRLSPVYLDDLVGAIRAAVLRAPAARTYHLVGPEEISFRELVERLGRYFGTRPRTITVPAWCLDGGARILAAAGMRRPPLYVDQVARLLSPKPYELDLAAGELGYQPRRLEEGLDALTGHERENGPP